MVITNEALDDRLQTWSIINLVRLIVMWLFINPKSQTMRVCNLWFRQLSPKHWQLKPRGNSCFYQELFCCGYTINNGIVSLSSTFAGDAQPRKENQKVFVQQIFTQDARLAKRILLNRFGNYIIRCWTM